MSDLPREGEVVLAGWDERVFHAKVDPAGWWIPSHFVSVKGWDRAPRAPDWWLPLSLARNARRLLEAAKRVKAAQFASSTEPFEAMNELDAAIRECEGK